MSSFLKKAKTAWHASTAGPSKHPQHENLFDDAVTEEELPPAHPVKVLVIGAGQRGKVYASYALSYPRDLQVIAVAEPRPKTRAAFATLHHLAEDHAFETWEQLLEAAKRHLEETGKPLADGIIIAVQDHLHAEVLLAFVPLGFHILCEKPLATNIEDMIQMANAVKQAGVIFGVGHVFRYSPYAIAITEVIRSGRLGQLVNVVQMEPVGYYHFAHSYVRGNWAKESESSFSLMTKCCHDMDILCHWLYPATPVRLSSFGSLTHFRKSQKPVEAGHATRCLDCPAEGSCPYSARKIYLAPVMGGNSGWPGNLIVDGPLNVENMTAALTETDYGLCVYESRNDVVDHQVVNMEYSTGATVSFTMVAFTSSICVRQTRMHFTHGELIGDMSTFTVTDFRTNQTKRVVPEYRGGGHAGGDNGIMEHWVRAVREGRQDILGEGSGIEAVLNVHLAVFAAEHSRKQGTVVEFEKFVAEKQGQRVTSSVF